MSSPRSKSALLPLVVVLPCVVWTCLATWRASFEPFGRDQGIFQYVAWALSRGYRDYTEVHDINGPLVPMIHLFFLKLGGADEHVFRSLDLATLAAASLVVGAALPGLGDRKGDEPLKVTPLDRVLWALASWIVLSAGYFLYSWWDHAQRESFFDDFLMPSVALQIWAQRPSTPAKQRRVLFAIAGALGAITWFGKPSCLAYSAGQLCALVFDDDLPGRRSEHVRAFALGCVAGCLPMLLLLAVYGDPLACVRIMLLDVFRLHRYIWHKSILESYAAWDNAPKLHYILATLALGGVGVATRVLPRRFLVAIALLVGGLVNFVVQGKGFPYHLQTASMGAHFLWLTGAVYFAERVVRSGYARRLTIAVGVGLAALAYQSMSETRLSPTMSGDWFAHLQAGGPESEVFLRDFTGGDYFALDLHQAAAYVRANTQSGDRVQTYAMDPYFLFLTQRLSATPYIYNFELNVDSALEGHPTESDRAWMLETARRNADDLLARLTRDPPAAFVTMDRVPYTAPADADADFARHCPEVATFVRDHYRLTARFGTVRVWLRADRAREATDRTAG